MQRLSRLASLACIALLCCAGSAPAGPHLTPDEALRLAFPGCAIERTTSFLTKEQRKRANELAGKDVGTSIVHAYVATRKGDLVGRAYFDEHRVRTLPETIMVVVDREDRIERIEVLSFGEPEQYLPRGAWYGQFRGKRLDEDLRLEHGIKGVTGATLTARATTDAARRVLALHAVTTEPTPSPPDGTTGTRP